MDTKKSVQWRDFLHLIKETKPSKWMMAIALLLSVATTVVGLIIPLVTKNLVDHFSVEMIETSTVMLLLAAFIVQAVSSGVSIYLLNHVGQQVVASLRERLWKKFLQLPIPFYDRNWTGEMISRMTNDTAIVKNLITDHLTSLFTGIISIVGSVIILVILDWQMTVMMLIAVPLMLALLFPLGRQMHRISKGLQDETASFTAVINQVLAEIRLVKASNAESLEYERGRKGISSLFTYGVREGKVRALISPLVSLVLMLVLVVIIGYGGMRVSSGSLSAGELVAFILYLFQIMMPMIQFTTFFTQLQKAKGATERIIVTLSEEEEDLHVGNELKQPFQDISFQNVSFAYKAGRPVLHGVTFTAPPGEITAIVGPSGGGKTTLFSLLERYYTPTEGKIMLGSDDIESFSLHSWRQQIGYVPQDSPMIAGTIRENIIYGLDRKVSEKELHHVAKMAFADQFIHEFPEAYDTEVGERGIKLSGGQRQRIGIARALLRDPNILMLDEATSSLDTKSEMMVQKALKNLMRGRTTLVIAHRLSTVVEADQIIFIERGEVTGKGTHEQLFEQHPLYREFATQQLLIEVDVDQGD